MAVKNYVKRLLWNIASIAGRIVAGVLIAGGFLLVGIAGEIVAGTCRFMFSIFISLLSVVLTVMALLWIITLLR